MKPSLFLELVAEIFDGKAAKFSGFLVSPFAPTLIAQKIVERSLSAL